jgi:hypothetical protein
MKTGYLFLAAIIFIFSCKSGNPDAEHIVKKAINAHGGDLYENSIIDFDFRGRHYQLERNQGYFKYHRIFSDSTGTYHDILSNGGFSRTFNDTSVALDEEWNRRYSNSVNSVAYFALLPFGLNDPSVRKLFLGEEEIGGNWYYKIKVTFSQEGGGEDFEDEFVYWIDKRTFLMGYFGYSYLTDGGGIRFREAINTRRVGGIVFSDYINYKGNSDSLSVENLATRYKNEELEKLSEIILENLEVTRIN